MTLNQLKQLYEQYNQGLRDWAESGVGTLDALLRDSRSREGAVALDILGRVPSARFTDAQLKEFFNSLVFWIQGPSRYYDKALALLSKHGTAFVPFFKESFRQAVEHNDDGLVQGLCHVFSLLDIEVQRALRDCVTRELGRSSSDVKEILENLGKRCRAFDPCEPQ